MIELCIMGCIVRKYIDDGVMHYGFIVGNYVDDRVMHYGVHGKEVCRCYSDVLWGVLWGSM